MEKELWFKRNDGTNHNVSPIKVQLWKFVESYIFRTSPHQLSIFRTWLLRMFGAKIGKGCYISPRISITNPWLLEMGNHSSLDDFCRIQPPVKIGDYVSIACNTHLISDGHDVRSRGFEWQAQPIEISDGVFVGADVFVKGGVHIGTFSVIGAKSTVLKDIPENSIAFGSPCKVVSERVPRETFEKYRFR